jgi:hypothetical protein
LTGGDTLSGNKAQDHNSSRSNKTAAVFDNSGLGGGGAGGDTGFQITFSPGYGSPLNRESSAEQHFYSGRSISSKISVDYFFGRFGIGVSNGFLFTQTDRDAFNRYIQSKGYDETTADLSTSDSQTGFIAAGPVFQTGRRLKIAADAKLGLFIASPGTVIAGNKDDGTTIMRVTSGGRALNHGISGGITVKYSVSPLVSIGINSEYTGTKTGMGYFDGKTGITTSNLVLTRTLVTAMTLTFNVCR